MTISTIYISGRPVRIFQYISNAMNNTFFIFFFLEKEKPTSLYLVHKCSSSTTSSFGRGFNCRKAVLKVHLSLFPPFFPNEQRFTPFLLS